MPQSSSILKNLLLSSVIATSMIAPSTATAQTVNVMVVNMRSADGVYRPALRVVRGGNVTFFRTDDTEAENPLTVSVIRNQARLMAWLMEAIPQTANETFDINIEVIQSTPSEQPAAPTPPASEPTSTETTTPTPEKETCGPSQCGPSQCGPSQCGPSQCGPYQCGPNQCGPYQCGPYQCGPTINICIGGMPCTGSVENESSVQFAQLSVADLSDEQRMQAYATL